MHAHTKPLCYEVSSHLVILKRLQKLSSETTLYAMLAQHHGGRDGVGGVEGVGAGVEGDFFCEALYEHIHRGRGRTKGDSPITLKYSRDEDSPEL